MSRFIVTLFPADLGIAEPLPEGNRKYSVTQMSWKAIGGADDAKIEVAGSEADLWKLIELLRARVEIQPKTTGRTIWHGFIEGVMVRVGALVVLVSLEAVSNRVKVIYSQVNVGGTIGERASTTWYQDDESVGAFGTKEGIYTLSEGTDEAAQNYAQTILSMRRYPIASHQFGQMRNRMQGGAGSGSAILFCRGWWSTLDWVHYQNSGGKESYEAIGNGLQAMGDASSRGKLAQSFQLAAATGWDAQAVNLRMKREGSPADNLVVQLCANNAGIPGTTLATGTLAGGSVDENLNWHELVLDTRVSLAIGTTYWLVVERSGAVDGTNYYKIDANEELGYTNGLMRMWNGSSWVTRSPDADMLFRVGGVEETTVQLARMLGEAGQFFNTVDVQVTSGVFSSPYRAGDESALMTTEDLLEMGTNNFRRMLATVDRQRQVIVTEEPLPGENDYLIGSDGVMSDPMARPLEAWDTPVGVWAKLQDVIPASADTGRVSNAQYAFIESAVYNADNDSVDLRERDVLRMME